MMPYPYINSASHRRFLVHALAHIFTANTGKLCTPPTCPRHNRQALPMQAAIPADRQFLPPGSDSPLPARPAIPAYRQILPPTSDPDYAATGKTCRRRL